MDKPEDLVIFSNGPGEVSTWVLPIVEAVIKREELQSRYRIILIIHPCQFASGREGFVGRSIEGIERVIGPREYIKMLIMGSGKRKHSFKKRGVIFSLGGNLMYPVFFKRRIRGEHLLYAYTNNTGWEKYYNRIFVRNEYVKNKFLKRGIPEDKIFISGDLVYSSLKYRKGRSEVRNELGVYEGEKMVIFMPGSRDFEVRYMVPVFLKVIDDLTDRLEGIRAFFLKSPYVSYEMLEEALAMGGCIREAESIPGTLSKEKNEAFYRIKFGKEKRVMILEGGLEMWGRGVDFAVTLPGTNTIELAYRGIPAVVIAPLNKPELIPVEGLIGVLKWFPWAGRGILRKAGYRYFSTFSYASLPNLYMNREVVPELSGVIKTSDITEKVYDIIHNERDREIRKKLQCFNFTRDPAKLIVNEVWPAVR
ncbi:MAG: hypothetical protein ACUVWJ_02695 [Spirochaetota bacterium]